MEAASVRHLLTYRVRRGRLVFGLIAGVSALFMGVAFIADGGKPWGVSGACVFGVFYYACLQMRAKERVGVRVSEKPELVYWVHPTVLSQALSKDSILSVSLITLHLRDATQFEVSMAPNEMRSFIEWLQSRNPAVRIGPYESDRSRQIG